MDRLEVLRSVVSLSRVLSRLSLVLSSPESPSASPIRTVCAGRRVSRPRPPPVPGTHSMTACPSTAPQRVPLPSTPASSLPASPDPESDSLRAASPAVTRFLATAVTDPLFESIAALVAGSASASVCPSSVGGECALGTDVLEDREEDFECIAVAQAAMDSEMASWKSTRTYVDEVLSPGANIVSGMWISGKAFLQGSLHEEIWLRRPPGFTRPFLAGTQWSLRRPVYGLRQAPREWHDTLRTTLAALGFAPSTADPSLFLRTDTTLPPFYVLVYVDDLVFATADTEALAHVKSKLAQRTITLTQSHMVQQVLQRFSFTYSSPQSSPLPTGHSHSAPPSDESVEPSGPYPELVGCLMYLMTCTRPDLAYPLSLLARYVALVRQAWGSCLEDGLELSPLVMQRSSQGYTFSLGSGSVSWRSTRSSSVLSSSCEAEIYAGAMAAQELRWLTYLRTDLGEAPRSPLVLYVDNKAMLALCQEHKLEHRTKHITLRYFLARELEQRGQLRLAYVASQANTADVFTKALQPCDHQPCFAFLDWSCDLLFSPTLPMGGPPGFGNPEAGTVAATVSAPQAPQARAPSQEWHALEGQGDRATASASCVANLLPGRNSGPPSQQNLDEIETARAAARPDFAAILESLDNTAQANLLQVLAQLSGAPARRVMECTASPSAANARATLSRSDRMERRNVSNPAYNVDALHQMTELLATLQRNHANGRPAHPENLRPATRHVEAPEAAADEEEGERGIF
ncbi:unnamed protein product [Closterium sp. NIES-53]